MAFQAFLEQQRQGRRAQYMPPVPVRNEVIMVQDKIALPDNTKPNRKPKIDTDDLEGDDIIQHIIDETPTTNKVRKLLKQYVSELDEDY